MGRVPRRPPGRWRPHLQPILVINVKNKSHAITAQIVVPDDGAKGVILVQGGMFGGWSIYAKDGRPTYCYNLLGLQRFKVEGEKKQKLLAGS